MPGAASLLDAYGVEPQPAAAATMASAISWDQAAPRDSLIPRFRIAVISVARLSGTGSTTTRLDVIGAQQELQRGKGEDRPAGRGRPVEGQRHRHVARRRRGGGLSRDRPPRLRRWR